jgi:hypothetical protein
MKPKLTIVIVDEHGAGLPVFKRVTREFPGNHVMCFPQLDAAARECAVHPPDIFVIDDEVPEATPMTLDPHFREHPGMGDAPQPRKCKKSQATSA